MTRSMHLNPAMQAVDVYVDIDGQSVRAVIPREVFEDRLRSAHHPSAWLRAAQEHAGELATVIRRRFAARPGDFVVVRSSDFGPHA
ncbi:hypothetical protein [Aquabacterium sp.]|uniref:hypothetical protein n=1 Tax=Aquabacterium sp. TaxID=1872578 RepID=UPI002B9C196E|nr:hypothetical protein [Aquabacterium sp.]HSW06408.1 hypothetical protein [Aquabacterium sp.]